MPTVATPTAAALAVRSSAQDTFDSLDPATGQPVATLPVHDADAVQAAVARARAAAEPWQQLGFDGRRAVLQRWKGELARRGMELASLVHRENGKPVDDAYLEVLLTISHLDWASRNANKVLGRRAVPSGLLMANQAATVEYLPFGVVGIIGPWNYPVFTPMGSIVYALAAGNTVVFKPSELTPAVGRWLIDSFTSVAPDPDVLGLVTGLAETGAALCRSGVDKLAFTGSARTGRVVMAACAESLTPVLMECGGKDAMIVADDADVDSAADAALWGAMSNAGQTCIGIERVYATDAVYDQFVARLSTTAASIRAGSDERASYGPITMPAQLDVIRRHLADAATRGAGFLVGGLDSVRAPYVDPVVLVDVPGDALAVTAETFGPTLTVTRVRDIDDAVGQANATGYGLGAAVFSRRNGPQIARRLRTGMASVNSVLSYAAVPALPFGGVGESGFGRTHGADGLREFARAQGVARQRFGLPVPLLSFARPRAAVGLVAGVLRAAHRG